MKTKKMQRFTSYILVSFSALLWFASTALHAQEKISEEVVAIGDKVITLDKAYKIDERPSIIDTVLPLKDPRYKFLSKELPVDFEVSKIKAAKLKIVEPLAKLYRGYTRVGIGTYTTPIAEVYLTGLRSRDKSYGIHLKHFSSNGEINNVGFSGFSDNEVHLWGKKMMRRHAVAGKFNYERAVRHYYGFQLDDTLIAQDAIMQRFNYFDGEASIASYFKDSSAVNYRAAVRFYNLTDLADVTENNAKLDLSLRKKLGPELYTLQVVLDYNNFETNARKYLPVVYTNENAILQLSPRISTRTEAWRLNVGLDLFADMTKTASFHFYPNAEFKYSFFDDILIPYAGLSGQINRNSFQTLRSENPFIWTTGIEMRNSNYNYQLYGGIRGTVSANTSFNLSVRKESIEDFALFVNAIDIDGLQNKFDVRYEDLERTTISGEITAKRTDKWTLFLRGDYFSYNPKNELEAWNLPKYRASVTGQYSIRKKIIARSEVFLVGDRKARSISAVDGVEPTFGVYIVDLKPYLDGNLNFEYRYTKRLSAFVAFNNIVASTYQRWYLYPTQGFQVLGGLTYSF